MKIWEGFSNYDMNPSILFLPDKYIFSSTLSKDQIIEKLNNITAKPSFWKNDYKKPYIGKIEGNIFNISPVIGFSRSIKPNIRGEIIQESNSCKIIMYISIPKTSQIFQLLWLILMLYISTQFWALHMIFPMGFIIFLGIFALGIILPFLFYNPDKYKSFLINYLKY